MNTITILAYTFISLLLLAAGFALALWRTHSRKLAAFVWPRGFVVLDCETTGLDPKTHSLLSVGAVIPATGERFYGECRVWNGAAIDVKAMEVNGETTKRAYDLAYQTEGELVFAYVEWAKGKGIVLSGGKNPGFDQSFLKAAWKRLHKFSHAPEHTWPLSSRTICLHSLAWGWALRHRPEVFTESTVRTDDLYVLMGLHREERPHRADRGAAHELQAFAHLLGNARQGGVK